MSSTSSSSSSSSSKTATSSVQEAESVDSSAFATALQELIGAGVVSRSSPTFGKQRQNCVLLSQYLPLTQEWSLSCTNFSDAFWRLELNASQTNALRTGSSIASFSEFFQVVRRSLLSNSLFLNLAPGRSNLEVRFTFKPSTSSSAPDESFITLPKITLLRVEGRGEKQTVGICLALVTIAQAGASASDELGDLRAQMSSLQSEVARLKTSAIAYQHRASADFDHDEDDVSDGESTRRPGSSPMSGSGALSRTPRKRITRRQPGYSLLNPSVKVKKARGVRYGEDISDESD